MLSKEELWKRRIRMSRKIIKARDTEIERLRAAATVLCSALREPPRLDDLQAHDRIQDALRYIENLNQQITSGNEKPAEK